MVRVLPTSYPCFLCHPSNTGPSVFVLPSMSQHPQHPRVVLSAVSLAFCSSWAHDPGDSSSKICIWGILAWAVEQLAGGFWTRVSLWLELCLCVHKMLCKLKEDLFILNLFVLFLLLFSGAFPRCVVTASASCHEAPSACPPFPIYIYIYFIVILARSWCTDPAKKSRSIQPYYYSKTYLEFYFKNMMIRYK